MGSALSQPLVDKIQAAIAVKANAVAKSSAPSAARISWAKSALASPTSNNQSALNYVLAENSSMTVAAILALTDAQIQTAVNVLADNVLGA